MSAGLNPSILAACSTTRTRNIKPFQVWIESSPYREKLTSRNGLFVANFDIVIISKPSKNYSPLEVQNDSVTIATDVLHYFAQDKLYQDRISVRDYSYLILDEYSNDKMSGCRLSLQLVIPEPINLCTYMDNFEEIPPNAETEESTVEIQPDENIDNGNQLILQPITL